MDDGKYFAAIPLHAEIQFLSCRFFLSMVCQGVSIKAEAIARRRATKLFISNI
jgi:hypothetical protein